MLTRTGIILFGLSVRKCFNSKILVLGNSKILVLGDWFLRYLRTPENDIAKDANPMLHPDNNTPPETIPPETAAKASHHADICLTLNDIYAAKNADYGDSFGETYRKLGIISAVTRISDKTNRLQTLCRHDAFVKAESIRDTLMDLANYCIMTVMEMDSQASKPAVPAQSGRKA